MYMSFLDISRRDLILRGYDSREAGSAKTLDRKSLITNLYVNDFMYTHSILKCLVGNGVEISIIDEHTTSIVYDDDIRGHVIY